MSSKKSSKAGSRKASSPRGFLIFFGLCIAAITGGILWFNARVSTLDCHRLESTRIDCTVETRWLGVLPLEQQTVQQLEGASVNRNCSKDIKKPDSTETCVTSVDLATAGGIVPLSPALASGGNEEHKYDVAAQINTFVNNPDMPSLRTVQTELGPQTIVLGLILLAGLAIVGLNTGKAIAGRRQTA
jgi:hypothetical protein